MLDLDRIEERLFSLSYSAEGPDDEPVHRDVTRRMLEGYRQVDMLLIGGYDLFAYGNSAQILELNHIVLCGRSPATREAAARHISETEAFFYDRERGDIGGKIAWYARNRNDTPVARAAGMFVEIVSSPQLFIEGNQRTATLIASYMLARNGLPPFVLFEPTSRPVFRLFSRIRAQTRSSILWRLRRGRLCRELAACIEAQADPAMLVAPPPSTGAAGTGT